LAVITNGSLLWRHDVRHDLAATDAVLPTLDAGSEELFQRINRPAPGLSLRRHVAGLRAFRRAYDGKLWLEVMLLHGVNTTPEAVSDLAEQVARIEPDAIHLTLPTRPPAERWVRPATEDEVEQVAEALSKHAPILAQRPEGAFEALRSQDPVESACDLVARHPVSESEMREALESWAGEASAELLARLESDGRVHRVKRGGRRFWVSAASDFCSRPDERDGSAERPRFGI
jgi:wyosine [tRNA(Phe)-imidazoG37] synthetase (radical SAM superfamily)